MTLQLVMPPGVEPLTATEAKARLNIGAEVTDAVMGAFITAARQMIDGANGWLGRALITQTWDLVVDDFGSCWTRPLEKGFYPDVGYELSYQNRTRQQKQGIVIPLPPLQTVTSVKYLDSDGVQQTLDSAVYLVQKGEPSHIVLATSQSWPSISTLPGAVTIRFVAGYGPAGSDVPETVRMAIALQASYLRSLSKQDLFMNREEIPGVRSQGWTVGSGAETAISGASRALLQGLRVWT